MTYIPPSGEVLAEEISVELENQGVPREEQGEIIAKIVRTVGDEISGLLRECQ